MTDPLAPLLADGVIDEVVARLKSGKEADVWLVRHGDEIVAAKVYKARHARNFKNNAAYKEGRQVRNTRTQRAMDRGSRFGQEAAEDAWKAKESDALHRLHAAGVRVPRPVLFFEGVLLMEVVVDAHGHPAPRLVDAHVPQERAAEMYADLRRQAVGMLACDLIHGDLSPYNVLVGASGPVIIDLPQVVGAAHNSQAEAFFRRDLENLHRFFAALDPALRAAAGDAQEIWRAYVRRELTADFVPTGKAPEPQRHGHGRGEQGHRRDAPRGGQGQGQGQGRERGGGGPPGARPHPQGGQHPQGGPHQRGEPHPQGGPHQRGEPHPQGGPHQQGRPNPQGRPHQQGGPNPQGRPHQQGGPGQQGRPHAQGGSHQRGGSHPQGGSHGQPATPPVRGGPHPARRGPMPEVIRVVRLDRPPQGGSGGSGSGGGGGGGGGQGGGAQGPGAGPRPGRRRRRRGGRR